MTLVDLWLTEELDTSEILRFSIPADDPAAAFVIPDHEVQWRGRAFYLDVPTITRRRGELLLDVEAKALWYRLADRMKVGTFRVRAETPADGLDLILAGTGWTAGTVTGDTSTFSLRDDDRSVLYLLRQWAAITGTYLSWDTVNKEVNLRANRGDDLGVGFRYGRDLLTARRQLVAPAVTRLYPYGADGLTVAGVNAGKQYLENLTWYTAQGLTTTEARTRFTRTRVWSDETITEEAELLDVATRLLDQWSQPTATYELDVVDLTSVDGGDVRHALGDTVRVWDPDIGDVRASVVARTVYPLQPWRNRITLDTLRDTLNDTTRAPRSSSFQDWQQFLDNPTGTLEARNDGRYVAARIPLTFSQDAGAANFHVDLQATGVGAGGTMVVDVYDAASSTVVWTRSVGYSSGETVHVSASFALEDLADSYDYRVRVDHTASGGASPTRGLDLIDRRFYVLARGAVRQSPFEETSQTFNYTGSVQHFTVPDGVDTVTIEAAGSEGGNGSGSSAPPGSGGTVVASFGVVPGTVLDVYVGGKTGWPNGGAGSDNYTTEGGPGGGASYVTSSGGSLSGALIVAAGGGGSGGYDGVGTEANTAGGDAGFLTGSAGLENAFYGAAGGGATSTAGGAAGVPGPSSLGVGNDGEAGDTDASGDGGDAYNPGSTILGVGSGGGGGGWHGGGGGGGELSGGGGGTGHLDESAFDATTSDGDNAAAGYVVFTWGEPDTGS